MAGTSAFAQHTAVMTGKVLDGSNQQGVGDAVVTATSPSMQGEQLVVTDSTGLFRLPQLAPGTYTFRVEREGFKPYERKGVDIRLDQTLRLNVEMLPEALTGETITVVGKAPTIDVGSAASGINIDQDFLRNISVIRPGMKGSAARSFEGLAELAPGANSDPYGVSIAGATSPENSFIVDGLSVNDPSLGIIGTPLTVEFLKEVNVITGGYLPEYGRSTGGVMNAVTKSGSNEFHGSVWGNWAPGALQSSTKEIQEAGSVISAQGKAWNMGDMGVELGGPILKDKLWFYAGIAPSFNRVAIERQLNTVDLCTEVNPANGCSAVGAPQIDVATGFRKVSPIDGQRVRRFADQRSVQYIAKLTYLLNADHNISLSLYGNPESSGGPGKYSFGRNGSPEPCSGLSCTSGVQGSYEATSTQQANNGRDISLQYSGGFFNKTLLIDATAGWHHQDQWARPSDGSAVGSSEGLAGVPNFTFRRTRNPGVHNLTDFAELDNPDLCGSTEPERRARCPVATYLAGGPGTINDHVIDRLQAKAVATYLFSGLGHHVLKAGLDVESMAYSVTRARSGGAPYRECGGGACWFSVNTYTYLAGPDEPVFLNTKTGSNNSMTVGGFIQDSWSVLDMVTVNLGVRYDAQTIWGQDKRVGLSLPNQWSPRVGLIYDFTQAGRSKIYANYARYFEQVPLDAADLSFPQQASTGVTYDTPPCLPADPAGRAACNESSREDLGSNESPERYHDTDGGDRVRVDPAIQPQSADEIQLGAEYEILLGRLGLSYTRRYMNNVVEDMSRDDGNTYFIGNPGKGFATDFPLAERNYDAVTLYYTKTFSDQWLAQVSYTWSYLRGNYNGLFRAESNQLEPNITVDFDLLTLTVNRYGALPGDATHSFKAFGAKEFSIGSGTKLNIGASYRGRSGMPLNYLGVNARRTALSETFILPRGSAGNAPFVHNIDAHLGLTQKLPGGFELGVTLDFFNLFDFQAPIQVDQRFTNAQVSPIERGGTAAEVDTCKTGAATCPVLTAGSNPMPITTADLNPNFMNPTAYQPPRAIRIGARLSF